MSDVQSKKTIQIGIFTSILCFIASGSANPSEAPVEPLPVGRYQIVMQPSDVVLRIDTYDGTTHRLVANPETGAYQWEKVNLGQD